MPKFQENTGFKLPGVGSKEIDTPGVFRKDQGVEDVGYCSNTEPHMLPKGSSPLLKSMIDQVVPEYYRTSYTRTSWPVQKGPKEETQTANPGDNKVENTTNVDVKGTTTENKETGGTPSEITLTKPGGYSGESAQSKLGRNLTQAETDWMNKEIKRLGGVQQYRDFYKIGKEKGSKKRTIKGINLQDSGWN